MSSGEVLFILAFIVLPTAILVSSVWAVLFVRRRPDRPVHRSEAYPIAAGAEEQPTALLAAVDSNDLAVTEHDVVVITEYDPEPVVDDPSGDIETVPVAAETAFEEEPAHDMEQSPVDATPVDSPVLQSTEDLGDVVDVLRDMDHAVEPEPEPEQVAAAPDVVTEPEPVEAGLDDDEVVFSETSELPLVEKSDAPEPDVQVTEPEPEPEPEAEPAASGHGWRRRKQAVKLVPGEAEAPRTRGRNRDAQRQVPQLGRAGRKRDAGDQSPPPEPDSEEDTTSARS